MVQKIITVRDELIEELKVQLIDGSVIACVEVGLTEGTYNIQCER